MTQKCFAIPGAESVEPGWWFVFSGNKLLVESNDQDARIPFGADLSPMGLDPGRKLFVGKLREAPCFCADCGVGVSAPGGMRFEGLRSLFGLLSEEFFQLAGRAFEIVDWDRTHRFCNQCGHPTADKEDERAKLCPSCGFVTFPAVSPAIIVAVVKGDQLLLARASRFPQAMYSVLAGFVEPGESLEECVRREVKEEVGVEVTNIRYFGSQPWPFPHSLMIGFTAQYAGGEITMDGKEIVDAGWFQADNLPLIPGKISIARQLIDWFVDGKR